MSTRSRTATAVRFDPEVYGALVIESDRLGLSMNMIVNRAVEKYVSELASVERVLP